MQEINDFIIDNGLNWLAIKESQLNPGDRDSLIVSEITPSSYKVMHRVPRTRGKEGGVAVILKSSFTTKVEKVRLDNMYRHFAIATQMATHNIIVRYIEMLCRSHLYGYKCYYCIIYRDTLLSSLKWLHTILSHNIFCTVVT